MRPRSTQLLSVPPRSPGYAQPSASPGLIASLEQYMKSILPEVRLIRHHFSKPPPSTKGETKQQKQKSDDSDTGNSAASQVPNLAAAAKDPEIVLYSSVSPQTVTIYR